MERNPEDSCVFTFKVGIKKGMPKDLMWIVAIVLLTFWISFFVSVIKYCIPSYNATHNSASVNIISSK